MNKEEKTISNTIKVIIAVGAMVLIVALYLLLSIETPVKPLAGHGDNIKDDAQIGGDFELTDFNGKNFNSSMLKGHLSMIYFGFTYCPDICPTSLYKLTEVLNTLDKYKINITPVFITIDPERDTVEVLKEYLPHFHPKFIGLTGSIEQIKGVADKFKVYYARSIDNKAIEGNKNYMIDHSSFVYLLDKEGQYLKHFYFSSSAEEIIDFIRVNNINN